MIPTPSAQELLHAWERAGAEPPYERALTLLGAAAQPGGVDGTDPSMAALSIGERDARLLQLRAALFGDEATAVITCPGCGTQLESRFRTSRFLSVSPDHSALEFAIGGGTMTLRLITTADLRAVAGHATVEALLERAIVRADGVADTAAKWSAEIQRRLELADPQAHIEIALRCLDCALGWTAVYDIVSFLWQEVDAWARRTLREVHLLASAYGWTEREILALSPARRQIYLGMIQA